MIVEARELTIKHFQARTLREYQRMQLEDFMRAQVERIQMQLFEPTHTTRRNAVITRRGHNVGGNGYPWHTDPSTVDQERHQ